MIIENWKTYISSASGKRELLITLLLLSAAAYLLLSFLTFVELRDGAVLPDPLLSLFNPIDVTWLTFAIIYISLLIAAIFFFSRPEVLVLTLQIYTAMIVIRMMAMYFLPLNPPPTMIPLSDPFVESLGSGDVMLKDLFFSGHTATMFILFLAAPKTFIKYIFLLLTIIIGILVIIQHVHYTIDVFAAPFFTYCAYRLVLALKAKNVTHILDRDKN